MFTGIIEATGTIVNIEQSGTNMTFWIDAPIVSELKIDQSVSHNGVCLTVEDIQNNLYRVTAIQETLNKTNLGNLKPNDSINLERCMQMNGRIDGHLVQGHVDTTAVCVDWIELNGSWEYTFKIDTQFSNLIIEKGSICINGISLTLFDVTENTFKVAVIPFTYEHTNIKSVRVNDTVNIEFDILGKYVNRMLLDKNQL